MPRPNYFVWIEISAIVGLLASFLVPLGLLAAEMMGGVGTGGDGGAIASGGGAPPRPGPGLSARRPAPTPRSHSLFGGGTIAPSGTGVETPFSADWRERATPDPTGSSFSSGGRASGGVGGEIPDRSGPTVASRSPSRRVGRRNVRSGRGPVTSGWRTEAQRFSGQARALSNQLGQMARSSSGGEEVSLREADPATTSASRTSASATAPGTPGDPTQAPIDDHLYWLVIAGVLWGTWRLWGT